MQIAVRCFATIKWNKGTSLDLFGKLNKSTHAVYWVEPFDISFVGSSMKTTATFDN